MTPEERTEASHCIEDLLCSEKVVAHDRGPMFWLRNITKTDNFQWMEQGLPPIAPFPYKPHPGHDRDYMDVVMGMLLTERLLGIPKTREMMTSWLVVGYITWMCQLFPNVQWLSQSEKDDKAMGLISYANSLYRNQPEWMKQKHPLKRSSAGEGTAHEIEWANGSSFIALPQGVRQSASYHPYGLFMDEAAHLPEAEATFNVARPAVKQIVMVSSAAPGWFGVQCDPSLEQK